MKRVKLKPDTALKHKEKYSYSTNTVITNIDLCLILSCFEIVNFTI